jgi:hypothetical protein
VFLYLSSVRTKNGRVPKTIGRMRDVLGGSAPADGTPSFLLRIVL